MELLDEENPGFSENTVMQFDGASYHRSAETRNYLTNIGVKAIISGPYGYEIAPIEMFFS